MLWNLMCYGHFFILAFFCKFDWKNFINVFVPPSNDPFEDQSYKPKITFKIDFYFRTNINYTLNTFSRRDFLWEFGEQFWLPGIKSICNRQSEEEPCKFIVRAWRIRRPLQIHNKFYNRFFIPNILKRNNSSDANTLKRTLGSDIQHLEATTWKRQCGSGDMSSIER